VALGFASWWPLPPDLVDVPLAIEIDHSLMRCQLPGLRLPAASDFLTCAARRPPIALQKTISSAIEDALLRSIGESPALSFHLRSLRQSGWLAAIPSRPELTMADDDFRLAARLRLRLLRSGSILPAGAHVGVSFSGAICHVSTRHPPSAPFVLSAR